MQKQGLKFVAHFIKAFMRKFYAVTFLLSLIVLSGCSKDILKSYDRRILGTWEVIDIDRYGFLGNDNLPFKEGGLFTFSSEGEATYVINGATYTGSWDLRTERFGEESKRALQVTVINYDTQQMRSDYFNDMHFTSTNRFNAYIEYGSRTYVYRFKRR